MCILFYSLNLLDKLSKTMPTNPPAVSTYVKTPQVKCDEIGNELSQLQEAVHDFNGLKNDKEYMKLDELLTRSLLKLDELDRSNEQVNQQRKTLIVFTHELADHLESKCQLNAKNYNNNELENKLENLEVTTSQSNEANDQ